jgi:hypothetical protein
LMNMQIEDYINKQKSPQKEICQRLRNLIFDIFPETKEEMKWGVPAFADGKFYIAALADHVNLGFSIKGLTGDEIALFDGGGKTMKHLQINSIDMDEDRITALLKMVGRIQVS